MSPGCPSSASQASEVSPPAAAARVVLTATLLASAMQPYMQPVLPGLKPYQPSQRMNVPSTCRVVLSIQGTPLAVHPTHGAGSRSEAAQYCDLGVGRCMGFNKWDGTCEVGLLGRM